MKPQQQPSPSEPRLRHRARRGTRGGRGTVSEAVVLAEAQAAAVVAAAAAPFGPREAITHEDRLMLPIAFAPAYADHSAASRVQRWASCTKGPIGERGAPKAPQVLPVGEVAEGHVGGGHLQVETPIVELVERCVDVPSVSTKKGIVEEQLSVACGTLGSSTADASALVDWPANTTSVMLRNIPNRYTPEELLHDMVGRGFEGAFDFFYLPTDFATKKNKGYGFVNLRSPDLASGFRVAFDGQRLTRYVTQKVLELTPAVTQGFAANSIKYLRHQAGRVQNPWFKPMIFMPVDGDAPEAAEAGDAAAPWRCLPLSQENLPVWVQQSLAVRSCAPGEEGAHACREAEAEDVEGSFDNDADTTAVMQAAVQKFLRSCRPDADPDGGSNDATGGGGSRGGGKKRGGRRRGPGTARLILPQ